MFAITNCTMLDLPLKQILANIESNTDLARSLNELGTLLRQEDARANQTAQECVLHALGFVSTEPLEVLRVLVNFCADNDDNRVLLVSNDLSVAEFWTWVFTELHEATNGDVCTRAIVLLGQFIHNIDEAVMSSAIAALIDKGAPQALLEYLRETHDGEVMELVAEFSRAKPTAIQTSQLEWIVATAMQIELDDDEIDEILNYASQAVFNATNVDDRSGVQLIPSIYRLIQMVPKDTANVVHIKRRLFSACGNVSSYPSYDNWSDIERNEALIGAENTDLYVVAAAAISLGNCVDSRESQERLLRTLDSVERVVAAVLEAPLGDVVQYQAFHLFNNIMTPAIASNVLSHPALLFRATKVVVDNITYYREIGAVYFKFLRKLIAMGDATTVLQLTLVWHAVTECDDASCSEVKLLLLQVACAHKDVAVDRELVRHLISHSLATQGSVDAAYVLQQIKTVAMVLHHYNEEDLRQFYRDQVESGFVLPFAAFLGQLQHAVRATDAGAAPVANNTKFLAASGLKFGANHTAGAWAELAAVCRAVVG